MIPDSYRPSLEKRLNNVIGVLSLLKQQLTTRTADTTGLEDLARRVTADAARLTLAFTGQQDLLGLVAPKIAYHRGPGVWSVSVLDPTSGVWAKQEGGARSRSDDDERLIQATMRMLVYSKEFLELLLQGKTPESTKRGDPTPVIGLAVGQLPN